MLLFVLRNELKLADFPKVILVKWFFQNRFSARIKFNVTIFFITSRIYA